MRGNGESLWWVVAGEADRRSRPESIMTKAATPTALATASQTETP